MLQKFRMLDSDLYVSLIMSQKQDIELSKTEKQMCGRITGITIEKSFIQM